MNNSEDVKSYQDLVIESLRKYNGTASLDQIYSYFIENQDQISTVTSDYKRSIRGAIKELKKKRILNHVDKGVYRLL